MSGDDRHEQRQAQTEHPQSILSHALDVQPPATEEERESFRRRMARALLLELGTVMQTLTASAFGNPKDGSKAGANEDNERGGDE